MNKKMLVIIASIVALSIVGFAYLLLQPAPVSTPTDSNTKAPANDSGATDNTGATAGQYVTYSESGVAQTTGTKILFFHAAWCPQCRQLEADIKNNTIPSGVTIFKIDYDSNQQLRQKYGVSLQTTLVRIDDQGNEVKKFVAYSEPTLQALIDNLL